MARRPVSAAPASVSAASIRALAERLRRFTAVRDPWAGQPARGRGPDDVGPLLAHWADRFDWAAYDERLASLPWTVTGDGEQALRALHRRADDPLAPVVVLLHGWPDSVLRFQRLLPLLHDVHVVAPALPGFPYALPTARAASVNDLAEAVAAAMEDLGYGRYTVSGGDVGGDVAEILADRHPERVASMHLTNVSARHVFAVDPDRLLDEGRTYIGRATAWNRANGGYVAEQSTRPRTLLTALGDSPAGLAAWLLEKIRDWSDRPDESFSTDELLTWVSAYWSTGTIGSSLSTYVEPATIPERTSVPTVVSAFAADIKPAPRSYVEAFVDLRAFITHDTGGHFAAWEQPEAYAGDLRTAVELGFGATDAGPEQRAVAPRSTQG